MRINYKSEEIEKKLSGELFFIFEKGLNFNDNRV